ncbi:hypothetical protein DBV05_g9907 [Lasiodiplodia theobromae]|uniref:DUF4238 domain-containing protein n=1 Tax=Lasiodiplodia theobromae TaxID=45133 RepID=A0A5N5D191_9PEZI|nr:hypothetical protein DBV05_g9907 [Lasiodiplodia theobromae]
MAARTSRYRERNAQGTQFHHFIPRFILRNFAAATQPPSGPTKRRGKSKGKPHDCFINSINLQSGNVEPCQLRSEFGIVDMYREKDMGDGYDLEKRLAQLESDAATIIRKAKKTFATRTNILALRRSERDCLRKFFFLMKYRNNGFHQRYDHDSLDTYNSDDKEHLREYMEKRKFKRPKDVWFDNIRQILALEMDPEMRWAERIQQTAYTHDALMFILHAQGSFMSFCAPKLAGQEFVLTENAYGIFEGPVSPRIDPDSGELQPGVYTEYHNFAPIAPDLMVVFRSFILPTLIDEGDQAERAVLLNAMKQLHIKPESADSILQDLPIGKCGNNYSKIVDGKFVPLHGYQGPSADHVFYFKCFPLEPRHVGLINELLLEEAWPTKAIAFRSNDYTKEILVDYLKDPRKGFKVVTDQPDDPRLKYLRKLERAVSLLGGPKVSSVYECIKLPKPEVHMSHWVATMVGFELLGQRQDLYEIYKHLRPGATPEDYFYDISQAGRMLFLRIKTDVIMNNCRLSDANKEIVRANRHDILTSLPIQRVWLYLKAFRNAPKFDIADFKIQKEPLDLDGPEDFVAMHFSHKGVEWMAQAMFFEPPRAGNN